MKKLFVLLVLFFTAVSVNPIFSQWEQTFGPFGWEARHLIAGNGYVYSSGGKIFRSSTNGMTWEEKGDGIWQWDATALFISDGRVFAAMDENSVGYLYFSDDNGENWLQHNTSGNSNTITGFAKIGNNLFFSTYRNGVFISKDNGNTWNKTLGTGNPDPNIYCLAALGNYLFYGGYDGLYRSSDNGSSWYFCYNPHFTIDGVYVIGVKDNTLYLHYGLGFSQYFMSSDYGNTFFQFGSNVPYINSFFVDGTYLYAATDDGVFRSSDDGINWNRIALEGESTHSLAVSNGNLITGTRDLGIFTSTNNGTLWINTGYRAEVSPQAIATINNTLLTSNGATGVLISRDNGNTFTEFNNLNLSFIQSFVKRGTDIFVGTTPYIPQRGGVFKSTDAGLTWSFIGLPDKEIYSVAVNGNYLYAGSFYDGVFRTSNDGATWAQINNGLQANWVKTLIVHNNILYAGTFTGLYSSTNNGDSWSLTAFQNLPVNALVIVDSKLFAATEPGVYVLGDSNNWTSAGLSDKSIYCIKAWGSNLIAGSYPGLFITTDYGNQWIPITGNMPAETILHLDFNDTYLFVGIAVNGIWKRPLAEILTNINEEVNSIPNNYNLEQNYPNPFNPETNIKYQLKESGFVTLKVYDILGNELATLVNEVKEPGFYNVKFSGNNLSSGIYFYKIDVKGKFSAVKKMILLR